MSCNLPENPIACARVIPTGRPVALWYFVFDSAASAASTLAVFNVQPRTFIVPDMGGEV